MRRRDGKRHLELEQFERFAAACQCVPSGQRAQPDPPEPDIVVASDGGRIGIELTDFLASSDGERERAREAEREKALTAARELYLEAGSMPVQVWISWITHPRFASPKRIGDRIAQVVADNPPLPSEIREVGNGFEAISPDLPITKICIARSASRVASEWRDGDMHDMSCNFDSLSTRIAKEGEKVSRYRIQYSKVWLVLTVASAGPSTWAHVTKDVLDTPFRALYDRVFLFDDARLRAYELRLAA